MATFHGQTVDVYEDFENALDASWAVTDLDTNIDTQSTANPKAGSQALEINFQGATAGGDRSYIRYDSGAVRDTLSVGMWIYVPTMTTYSAAYYYFYWGASTPGTYNCKLGLVKTGDVYELRLRGTGFSANRKTISSGVYLWATLDIVRNGTCTLRVYDSAGSEVDAGTSVTVTGNNSACQYGVLGSGADTPTDENVDQYTDDFVADWTDATFPLLGWDTSGGLSIPVAMYHYKRSVR